MNNEFALQDDVVLAAALDFIDSFDSDSDPSPVSLFAPSCAGATKRPRTTSGQRTRAEIERLRGVVAELEACVDAIKQTDCDTCTSAEHVTGDEPSAWAALASRERHERQLAETKNAQLRELLVKQTLVVRKLEQLVKRGRRFQTTSDIAKQLLAEETQLHQQSRCSDPSDARTGAEVGGDFSSLELSGAT